MMVACTQGPWESNNKINGYNVEKFNSTIKSTDEFFCKLNDTLK
jgi:hypothetical protein